jgi:hypothetical protein
MKLQLESSRRLKIWPSEGAQFTFLLTGAADHSRIHFSLQSKSRAFESRWLRLELAPPVGASRRAILRVHAEDGERLPIGTHRIRVGVRDEALSERSSVTCKVVVKKDCVFMPEPPSFSIDGSGQLKVSIRLSSCGDLDLALQVTVCRRHERDPVGSKKEKLKKRSTSVEVELDDELPVAGAVLSGCYDIYLNGRLLVAAHGRVRTMLRRFVHLEVPPLVTLFLTLVTLAVLIGYVSSSSTPTTSPSGTATPPSALSASPGARQVLLSWTAPGSDGGHPITGYEIYKATYPTLSNRSLVGTVGASMRTYKVTDLNDGTTYFFVVQALTLAGTSPRSNEAYAVPSTSTPPPTVPTTTPTSTPPPSTNIPAKHPSAPTGLTAVATTTDGEITLQWATPSTTGGSPIIGYDIYWRIATTDRSGITMETEVGSRTRSDIVRTLRKGVLYDFAITAVNATGQSPKSTVVTAELPLPRYQRTGSSSSSTTGVQ